METKLHTALYAEFNIPVTSRHVTQLERYLTGFETRPNNSAALGSPLLGIDSAYFHPADVMQLFDIFGVSFSKFKRVAHSATIINTSFVITSSPFNLLTIWLVHLFETSKLSKKDIYRANYSLLKMLQYSFFTSIVGRNLKHGANRDIMEYTINSLSNKSAIRVEGSWKHLIEHRAERYLAKSSIHHHTFVSFAPCEKVVYILSDIQTRLRKQIVKVTSAYYDNHRAGRGIKATALIENIGGTDVVRAVESSMDKMVTGVTNSVTNLNEFLDYEYIDIIVKLVKDINKDMFIYFLTKFSSLSEEQLRKHKQREVTGTRNAPIYVGYEVLIATFLQKTYRQCILDKVDMGNRIAILTKTKNIYTSSRIKDKELLIIKDSTTMLIDKHSKSKRIATNVALRGALLMYLILLSFRYIK